MAHITGVVSHCRSLAPGWRREEIVKQSGVSAGRPEIHYISPKGVIVKNKIELAKELGPTFDLSTFDFKSGKFVNVPRHSRAHLSGQPASNRPHYKPYDLSVRPGHLRYDTNLTPPIRQTASILKQSVTVIKNHPDSISKKDVGRPIPQNATAPKQLFWVKRLEALRASDADSSRSIVPNIPQIQGIGPEMDPLNLLQSVAASLHTYGNHEKLIGQSNPKSIIQKNPCVNIDPNQPIVQPLIITDEEILKQEQKVSFTRNRLKHAMREMELMGSNHGSEAPEVVLS